MYRILTLLTMLILISVACSFSSTESPSPTQTIEISITDDTLAPEEVSVDITPAYVYQYPNSGKLVLGTADAEATYFNDSNQCLSLNN